MAFSDYHHSSPMTNLGSYREIARHVSAAYTASRRRSVSPRAPSDNALSVNASQRLAGAWWEEGRFRSAPAAPSPSSLCAALSLICSRSYPPGLGGAGRPVEPPPPTGPQSPHVTRLTSSPAAADGGKGAWNRFLQGGDDSELVMIILSLY